MSLAGRASTMVPAPVCVFEHGTGKVIHGLRPIELNEQPVCRTGVLASECSVPDITPSSPITDEISDSGFAPYRQPAGRLRARLGDEFEEHPRREG
jgi:hypothetical protein